jgi:hypothetical protein
MVDTNEDFLDDSSCTDTSSSLDFPGTYDHQQILESYQVTRKANQFPTGIGAEYPLKQPNEERSKKSARSDFNRRDGVVRTALKNRIGCKCDRYFWSVRLSGKAQRQMKTILLRHHLVLVRSSSMGTCAEIHFDVDPAGQADIPPSRRSVLR